MRQSPLTHADKIRTPLLVVQGANDPRVNKRESDQIVIALRDRGYPIQYLVAPDEGHGFARPVNNMAVLALSEKFMAQYLGGRYQESMIRRLPSVCRRSRLTRSRCRNPLHLRRNSDPRDCGANDLKHRRVRENNYRHGKQVQPLYGGCIFLQIVVSRAGLEPATHWLKASSSQQITGANSRCFN